MARLSDIRDTVQRLARAVSGSVGLEMIVIDRDLQRVTSTWDPASNHGAQGWQGAVFQQAMASDCDSVLAVKGVDSICASCHYFGSCTAKSVLMAPVKSKEGVLGMIGFEAWTEAQKQRLVKQRDVLHQTLVEVGGLVAAKAEHEALSDRASSMESRLHALYDVTDAPMVEVDRQGRVVWVNEGGSKVLGARESGLLSRPIEEVWPDSPVKDALRGGLRVFDRATVMPRSKTRLRCRVAPIRHDQQVTGALAAFTVFARDDQSPGPPPAVSLDDLLGQSPAMQLVRDQVRRVSPGDSTVLIRGETGTGKELLARVIHWESGRRHGPFVAINCAAVPESLLESEFFGYEEGAFTGARRGGKPGKFELADGGTLFLDEIGDMPPSLQAKLLRVLQERQVERIGGTAPISVDIRVVAATHRDLEAMVQDGQFRADLYYRINIIPIQLPPIRQRREDIPLLARHFLRTRGQPRPVTEFSPDAIAALVNFPWPGNIRQLQNATEYALNIAEGERVELWHLPEYLRLAPVERSAPVELPAAGGPGPDPAAAPPAPTPGIRPLRDAEREMLLLALALHGWNLQGKKRAAAALGVSLATLYRWLKDERVLLARDGGTLR